MMKKLRITFRTKDGHQHTFTPRVNVEKLTQAQLRAFLVNFLYVNQHSRMKDTFDGVLKAVVVERKTQQLFRRKKWQPKKSSVSKP